MWKSGCNSAIVNVFSVFSDGHVETLEVTHATTDVCNFKHEWNLVCDRLSKEDPEWNVGDVKIALIKNGWDICNIDSQVISVDY